VTEQFIERHCNRSNRPRTAAETARLLQQHVLPQLRGRKINEISRRDILDVLDKVVDNGAPISANRTLAAVRKLFNWCVSRDIIAVSPCAGVKPPTPERARDRVLSDDELVRVWRAAEKIGGPFGALVQLLALTGQRRDEVAGMRWDELSPDVHLWTLPRGRVKTDQGHEVPLSAAATAILKSIPRITDSPFVLTTNGTAPSSGYSKGKRKLDALLPSDMPAWRLHDLRRTVASGMARLGINLPVIEKVLNHSSGSFAGVVSVYQKHSFADEKRAALDSWSQHIERVVSGKLAKVVQLHLKT
jgi:integrase